MFKLQKRTDDYSFEMFMLSVTLLVGTIFLSVYGTVDSYTPEGNLLDVANPIYLYLGLPLLYGILIPLLIACFYEIPTVKAFKKSGIIWNRCPYIIWIIKGLFECLIILSVYILLPIICFAIWSKHIIMLFYKLLSILAIICTIPDGKAEAKVKQIWSSK